MFVLYFADDIKAKMQSVSRNMHMPDILCFSYSVGTKTYIIQLP